MKRQDFSIDEFTRRSTSTHQRLAEIAAKSATKSAALAAIFSSTPVLRSWRIAEVPISAAKSSRYCRRQHRARRGLGGRQVEQRSHQFDRRSSGQGHRGQYQHRGAAYKNFPGRHRMGTTCATIIASATFADWKRAQSSHPPNRSSRQRPATIGRPPCRLANVVARPPMKKAGHSFDQMIGREDLALLIENQRREADDGECFAGRRARSAASDRQECATRKMGPQLVDFSA